MAKNRRLEEEFREYDDSRNTKRQKGPPKTTPPLYKAEVVRTADSASVRVSSSTADLDESILIRMKKCLTRANHPETPEHEAKAALHIAAKLMRTYNVSQAEVLAHEAPEEQRKYAGSSLVAITRRDGRKDIKVMQNNYIGTLCSAMKAFFGCKTYTDAVRGNIEITFFGIAENTVAAASAFEMVYNLMVEWARPYKGMSGKNSYCYGISDELLFTAQAEKRRQDQRARKADEDAKAAQLQQEQLDNKARLDRLHELQAHVEDEEEQTASNRKEPNRTPVHVPNPVQTPKPEISSALQDIRDMYASSPDCSDNEEDDSGEWTDLSDDDADEPNNSGVDYCAADFNDDDDNDEQYLRFSNIDDEITHLASTIKSPSSPERKTSLPFRNSSSAEPSHATADARRDSVQPQSDHTDEPEWKSHMQLIKFRETTDKIADDWLKDQGIKLYSSGKQRSGVSDWNAFMKGQEDSKKIDVRRKTIAADSNEERGLAGDLLLAFT